MEKFRLSPTLGLNSFSDLAKQPGFRQGVKLDEDLKRFAVIVEPYNIPDLIPCGLTCHQGHNRGYLLRLADGTHTNVGRDCGSTHFGASDFDGQVKTVRDIERSENHKKSINELLDLIPDYRRQAHDFWHRAKPLGEALDNFKALYPEAIYQDLRNRAQRRTATVMVTRKLDDTEKAAQEKRPDSSNKGGRGGKKSNYVQTSVGDLRGLSIFLARPRSCLRNVQSLIKEVEEQRNDDVTPLMLAKYARYKSVIIEHLSHTDSLLDAGNKFFEENNFKLLPFLCEGQFANELESIAWDFDSNKGRKLSYGQRKRLRQRKAS